jgi:hypothetical protein
MERDCLVSAKASAVWVHRTVRWCTGQCPVCQVGSGELGALGNKLTAYDYNAPDCPVSHRSGGPTIGCAICARHVAEPTVARGHRTVRCAPDSVRCANGSQAPTVGYATEGKKSAPDSVRCAPASVRCANGSQAPTVGYATEGKKSAPDSVRCAPDYPVRQATEGKICLPGMLSTAPSCLGAIKGTPRRMEENTKHPLSIPKH